MGSIIEEIDSYLGCGEMTDEEFLSHYGMPRRSGRYPWGSGDQPYQSSRDFLGRVEEMRKSGLHILIQRLARNIQEITLLRNHLVIIQPISEPFMQLLKMHDGPMMLRQLSVLRLKKV